ncbi:hypothetical protein AAEX28_06545 [Lentisphaerota bacterium WC36G]|nr:hypothetical protein LJT99_09410 [Lentisphaerae bacterium WC36]
MNEEITAFELNDILFKITSDDDVVYYFVDLLWFYYDDCIDPKVVAEKSDWDLFNRLLLKFNCEFEISSDKKVVWK